MIMDYLKNGKEYGQVVKSLDERVDRLEKIVRSEIIEPKRNINDLDDGTMLLSTDALSAANDRLSKALTQEAGYVSKLRKELAQTKKLLTETVKQNYRLTDKLRKIGDIADD